MKKLIIKAWSDHDGSPPIAFAIDVSERFLDDMLSRAALVKATPDAYAIECWDWSFDVIDDPGALDDDEPWAEIEDALENEGYIVVDALPPVSTHAVDMPTVHISDDSFRYQCELKEACGWHFSTNVQLSWLQEQLNVEQGYPLEAQIEEALLPLVFEAICSAYRMSEQAVDDVGARIRGLDKKKIADSIYRMLPDRVGDHDLTLVKNIIPQDRFVVLVQDAFDRFDRFFIQHQRHFDELFEAWKAEQQS